MHKFLTIILLFALILTGCKGQNEAVVSGKHFSSFAIYENQIYSNIDVGYLISTIPLPIEENYFCIEDGFLYYVDQLVGEETGELQKTGFSLLRSALDGSKKEVLIEFSEATHIDLFLQKNFIYCSFFTKNYKDKQYIVDITKDQETKCFEINMKEKQLLGLGQNYLYYLDLQDQNIYASSYDFVNIEYLFSAPENESGILYDGKNFYYIMQEKSPFLIQLDSDGTVQSKVELYTEGIIPTNIKLLFIENSRVYYQISGNLKKQDLNTAWFEMKLDGTQGKKIREFYQP